MLAKSDCSGHIIKFLKNTEERYVYISLRLRGHLAEGKLVSGQTKLLIFPSDLFTFKFSQKVIRYIEIVLKNIDFWLFGGLSSCFFYLMIDFGCKNAKTLSLYVFCQLSSLITLKY